jgi:hypothetical protein
MTILGRAAFALLAVAGTATAQNSDSVNPLFQSHETLTIRIVAPFNEIVRDRSIDEDVPGKLELISDDGSVTEFDIGIRARGMYRRKPSVCAMPPLKLNFKKSQVVDTLFSGQNKLKLVTDCQPKKRRYKQVVLSEYMTYRLLNKLTTSSFQVRLLNITFAENDEDQGRDTYAFLIEHDNSVADRLAMPLSEIERTTVSQLEPAHLNLVYVFQYMIGNTDFATTSGGAEHKCCHNSTLFGNEGGPYIAVPYDFDMAALVDAPYAEPNPKLRLYSVKERLYRGRCVNNDLLPATLDRFRAERGEIESTILNQAELAEKQRDYALDFLASFYDDIESDRRIERNFIKKCR